MSIFDLDLNPKTYPSGKQIYFNSFAAPMAKPVDKTQIINIARDYKWTKTLSEGRKDVPTIHAREMYPIKSSFISNLQYAANTYLDVQEIVNKELPKFYNDVPYVRDYIKRGVETVEEFGNKLGNIVGRTSLGDDNKHLEPYYNLYGTEDSGFIYKYPYLLDDWKTTQASWDKGLLADFVQGMFSAVGAIEQGFSMEAAKSYNYPTDGPSIRLTFFLDNTKDVSDGYFSTSWNDNWQYIFLQTYQSIPNRKTRYLAQPPTLYELRLPGVYYYPYSYISEIQVICHGVRKEKNVNLLIEGRRNVVRTTIPEVYEVNLAFTSLLPETKNLYYESLRNSGVTVRLENDRGSSNTILDNVGRILTTN